MMSHQGFVHRTKSVWVNKFKSRRVARFLFSRRVLAAAVLFMAIHNLNTWHNVEGQGSANFFCSREEFPAIPGPLGLVITSHQTDCDLIAKESMTYVYLHPRSEHDTPSTLILRYDGNMPHPVWIDPAHVFINVERLDDDDIEKLVGIRNGIHIGANFIETGRASIEIPPSRSPATPD